MKAATGARLRGASGILSSGQGKGRLYAEMFEQLAPATEGRVVNPGRKHRGRLVFGDDTGQPR